MELKVACFWQATENLRNNMKNNKNIIKLLIIALIVLIVCAVAYFGYKYYLNHRSRTESISSKITADEVIENNNNDHEEASDYSYDEADVINIQLNNDSIDVDSDYVTIDGKVIIINSAGTYRFSGTLNDGQILVNSRQKDVVRILLNNVNISNSATSPIYIEDSDKTVIILENGTSNFVSDTSSYANSSSDGEPNAAIFSKDNLSIYTKSDGKLTVEGNYNDGIASKDGFIVRNAIISITSVDDGLRGKNYFINRNGQINITSGGDGIKADNEEDTKKGYVLVENGNITISAKGDDIEAASDVIVKTGTLFLKTTANNTDNSSKGIKAISSITIDDGTFEIDSYDDALHSNGTLTINAGNFVINTQDDALHADSSLSINYGDINIEKCYEGIESADITINGGTIKLKSDDDGINGAGGNDSSGTQPMGGGPQDDQFRSNNSSDYFLLISGGDIYINAAGDGVDVNGSIEMTGGTLIVNGPTANDNGALDYDGTFNISGGFLVVAGSSGMAQAPSTSSTQYSIMVNFSSVQSADQIVNVQSNDGENIITFAPIKKYQSIVVSCGSIQKGQIYNVNLGGTSTGESTNGLFESGVYSGGDTYTSITINNITTSVGTNNNSRPR